MICHRVIHYHLSLVQDMDIKTKFPSLSDEVIKEIYQLHGHLYRTYDHCFHMGSSSTAPNIRYKTVHTRKIDPNINIDLNIQQKSM